MFSMFSAGISFPVDFPNKFWMSRQKRLQIVGFRSSEFDSIECNLKNTFYCLEKSEKTFS